MPGVFDYLVNTVVHVQVEGKSERFTSRVIAVSGLELTVTTPGNERRHIWPRPGTALLLFTRRYEPDGTENLEDGVRCEVVRQILKPTPGLVLCLDGNQPLVRLAPLERAVRTIAVTSGKGGTGKSVLAVNLALALASLGERVTLVDCDLGTGNVAGLFGVQPERNLTDLLEGRASVDEIALCVPGGVSLVPGGTGDPSLFNLSPWKFAHLLSALAAVEERTSFVVVDTSPGISQSVANLLLACDEVIMVTTIEPPSVIDSYALVKLIAAQERRPRVWLVLNRAAQPEVEGRIVRQVVRTASELLGFEVQVLGLVREDDGVHRSVVTGRPLLLDHPIGPAAQDIRELARRLITSRGGKAWSSGTR